MNESRTTDRRRYAVAGVALVLAAMVGLAFWLLRGTGTAAAPQSRSTPTSNPSTSEPSTSSPAGLACPTSFDGPPTWVPEKSVVPGTSTALVPLTTPTAGVVCTYKSGSNMVDWHKGMSFPLEASTTLIGGLELIPDQLGYLARDKPGIRVCTLMGGPQTNRLVGLRYPTGIVWIAATDEVNGCIPSSNGTFTANDTLGKRAATASQTGRWPATSTASCAFGPSRTGEETHIVPPGHSSAIVCDSKNKAHAISPDVTTRLVAAISDLTTSPVQAGRGGTCTPGRELERTVIVFRYPAGPPVRVDVYPHCSPQLQSSQIAALSAPRVIAILRHEGFLPAG